MSDNILAGILGALEGVQKSTDYFLQDAMQRRRRKEEIDALKQSQMDLYRDRSAIDLEQKRALMPEEEASYIRKVKGAQEPTIIMNQQGQQVGDPIQGNVKFLPVTKPNQGLTVAQTAVDKAFAKDYADYTAGGGFADTMTQISSLDSVLADLKGGKKNLTGPVISAQPDWTRKRLSPDSMTAQQSVEQSIQRTLRKTLGAQFTEVEGRLFMQRGYDPALSESDNAKKLETTLGQLKIMATAKQQAIDFYEENGTLNGFKGKLYTLKNGEMVETSKDDFYKMMGVGGGSGSYFSDPDKQKRYEEWKKTKGNQ